MGVMLGITGLMWSVSAEREFRHKMPEVRIERIGTVPGWIAVTRILLTRSATARQIRTFEILVEADHRAREGTEGGGRSRGLRIERREEEGLDVEIRRLWDTACSAAVVKTFVYMREEANRQVPPMLYH